MRISILLVLVCCVACGSEPEKSMAFYYWRTGFRLNATEQQALQHNSVNTLYVRYCDIDVPPGSSEPQPVSPVRLDAMVQNYNIVPVVFIRNRTFEQIDSAAVVQLSNNLFRFVSMINKAGKIKPAEIQFDCDWTERTKNNYFLFLRHYQTLSGQIVSSTIRLHQVKYPQRTGVPPVHHGVLMYYNMGSINAGQQNSIYESDVAAKYNSFIRSYPLTMDIALPIFSWGQKIRDGKVVELLNKIYFSHFANDSNFSAVRNNWFSVKNACFKAGYYFAAQDAVKIESVSKEDLLDMASQIERNAGGKIRNLIFYDLDSANLVQYEKDVFKEILDRLD